MNQGDSPPQKMKKMSDHLPTLKRKMLKLQVIVRNGDRSSNGKNILDSLFSFFEKNGVSGATAWMGTRGYGSRGVARADILGLSIKLPVIVETVDLPERLEPLLPNVKEIVGGLGLITVEEVTTNYLGNAHFPRAFFVNEHSLSA